MTGVRDLCSFVRQEQQSIICVFSRGNLSSRAGAHVYVLEGLTIRLI